MLHLHDLEPVPKEAAYEQLHDGNFCPWGHYICTKCEGIAGICSIADFAPPGTLTYWLTLAFLAGLIGIAVGTYALWLLL